MLDINLFREEKGGNPEAVRESQRRRYASVEVVDEVIRLDKEWRQRQFELEGLRKDFNRINKAGDDAIKMIKSTDENKRLTAEKEAKVQEAKSVVDKLLETIGNLVHDSVPVTDDEVNNAVVRTWGDRRMEEKLKNHVEFVELLGIADLVKAEMLKCVPPPSRKLSKHAPLIHVMKVKPEKVNAIIGTGGKKVKSIIEETGVEAIDTQYNGIVKITARDLGSLEKSNCNNC